MTSYHCEVREAQKSFQGVARGDRNHRPPHLPPQGHHPAVAREYLEQFAAPPPEGGERHVSLDDAEWAVVGTVDEDLENLILDPQVGLAAVFKRAGLSEPTNLAPLTFVPVPLDEEGDLTVYYTCVDDLDARIVLRFYLDGRSWEVTLTAHGEINRCRVYYLVLSVTVDGDTVYVSPAQSEDEVEDAVANTPRVGPVGSIRDEEIDNPAEITAQNLATTVAALVANCHGVTLVTVEP